MRSVLFAYGAVGHAALEELLAIGAEIALVVTHADAPGENIWFPSVAALARDAGIPVRVPENVNGPEVQAHLDALAPDLVLSVYCRSMLSRRVLESARYAALNLHGSLLPLFRGRCPVNWVLVKGESETGVTLHHMDGKADHGDIVAQRRVAIGRTETALGLTQQLAAAGRSLLRETYPRLVDRTALRIPQDHARASTFGGRGPADGRVDWAAPAESIRNLVRAVTHPWPGAFTEFRGSTLPVWAAETHPAWTDSQPGELRLVEGRVLVATGEGALELCAVAGRGDAPLSGAEWWVAAGVRPGERLGELSPAISTPGRSDVATDVSSASGG